MANYTALIAVTSSIKLRKFTVTVVTSDRVKYCTIFYGKLYSASISQELDTDKAP